MEWQRNGVQIYVELALPTPEKLNRICRNSSVGRARDWKSLCPWFNSELRHILLCIFISLTATRKGAEAPIPYLSKNVTFSHLFLGRVAYFIMYIYKLNSNSEGSYRSNSLPVLAPVLIIILYFYFWLKRGKIAPFNFSTIQRRQVQIVLNY